MAEAFYITYEDGQEVRTRKGRGPTRHGFVQRDDGNWYYDPDNVQTKVQKNAGTKFYVFFNEQGNYSHHRVVTRGRPPKDENCFKFEVLEGVATPLSSISENINLDTLPSDWTVAEAEESTTEQKITEVVHNEEPMDQADFIRAIKGVPRKDGDSLRIALCDISENMQIEAIRQHRHVSRIDLDLAEGSAKIWLVEYRPDNPDIIVYNAFEEQVQKVAE